MRSSTFVAVGEDGRPRQIQSETGQRVWESPFTQAMTP